MTDSDGRALPPRTPSARPSESPTSGPPPGPTPSAAALDRFAKHIANEVARILRAELAPQSGIAPRVAELELQIERLQRLQRQLNESHANALEAPR